MILASGIPKFCIRGLLGDTQRKTLYEFCNVISLLAAEGVNVSELDSLECRVHRVLPLLERDIPVSLHVMFFTCFTISLVHPTLLCLPKGHKCNVEETILYTQQYVIHKYDMASNEVIA